MQVITLPAEAAVPAALTAQETMVPMVALLLEGTEAKVTVPQEEQEELAALVETAEPAAMVPSTAHTVPAVAAVAAFLPREAVLLEATEGHMAAVAALVESA